MTTHLITGAGSGIGTVLARRLADRGDSLVLVARSAARGVELAERFEGATALVADLADPGSLADLELPDSLDSVVHAAGVIDLGTVAEIPTDSWREQVEVNLLAPAELTRLALPGLRAARGTVVFVNSGSGLHVNPTWAAYGASKFGLRALADGLRQEEQDTGVRVSTVYPGRVATPMQQRVHDQEGKAYDEGQWIRPETVADSILHVLDLPRDATIDDLRISPTP